MSAPASPKLTQHLIDRDLPDYDEAPVALSGKLPSWLCGTLYRASAGSFREGSWRAEHLFDGLATMLAFELRPDGSVRYRQRLLDTDLRRRLREGRNDTPHFYTGMQRAPLARLLSPVPRTNDNTNVNVLSIGGALVAMTESSRQHEVDPSTLETLGALRYADPARGSLLMLAHPQRDRERQLVVNLGTRIAPKPALVLFEYPEHARRRRIVAELPLRKIPYIHSFGLTPRYAVLFGNPLSLAPLRLLWSNRGYIRHFRPHPERDATIYCVERSSGQVRRHRAPPCFVFHVINTFERDGDLFQDVLAYDDAAVIDTLSIASLRCALPEFNARPLRIRLREGVEEAEVTSLASQPFEFPTLHEARTAGRPYRYAWGTFGARTSDGYDSAIVQLEPERGAVMRCREPDFVFGEPLFVPSPDPRSDRDGVLLSVALHVSEPRAALAVIDAESLSMRAWGAIDRPVPLSFHGCFRTARA